MSGSAQPADLVKALARLTDTAARAAFLDGQPELVRTHAVAELADAVFKRTRADLQEALALAEGAQAMADRLRDPAAHGWATWAKGVVFYEMGQSDSALALLERAGDFFAEAGQPAERGRTLHASIQPLIRLGEYDRALATAAKARDIFTRLRDPWRLARLDLNVGNLLHRQDQFEAALALYTSAAAQLEELQDVEGTAAALSNLAVTLMSLDDFPRALETYRRGRAFCARHGMPLLVAQADYNVAYLYYLRGDYSRAIEMLGAAREACGRSGDPYHAALCQLDLAEIHLELRLVEEAAALAEEALSSFRRLGTRYEAAKAMAFLAMALSQSGQAERALAHFAEARGAFVAEGNEVWPHLIDVYRAVVLCDLGRLEEGALLCEAALAFFASVRLPRRAALCHLLRARLALAGGDPGTARDHAERMSFLLEGLQAPALAFEAALLLGQAHEMAGHAERAQRSYQAARGLLEELRLRLPADELKVAFLKDRATVYERLVGLCLSTEGGPDAEQAFAYMEEGKSRALMDAVWRHTASRGRSDEDPGAGHVRAAREELNWCYRRLEQEELSAERGAVQRAERLQARVLELEGQLLRLARAHPNAQAPASAGLSLDAIRATLPPDTTLLEYFRVDERLVAAVVSERGVHVQELTGLPLVRERLRLLRFQLGKFALGPEYGGRFRGPLLEAARAHLRGLYMDLVAPVRERLRGRHLVVVPHDVLHHLPFHALRDEAGDLIDAFTISYAPSASLFCLCRQRPPASGAGALILGVGDERTPGIEDEVSALAVALPGSELLIGDAADLAALEERGPGRRVVHIASHGVFRQDNPIFSRIRLGRSYLSLYDLYHLRLPADLVTLSGCGTGLNVVAAGDELLGLVRGFLHAGARALLVSLWDVHDRRASELMRAFYGRLDACGPGEALRHAALELRERDPHPYFWAPFVLVGDPWPVAPAGGACVPSISGAAARPFLAGGGK